MKKGQTVLEFLFLMLVIIVYLTTLVVPMAKDAQGAISDSEKIARANNETQKLANAIQQVSMMGTGSRQTVDVFVPEDTNINCNGKPTNTLSFQVALNLKPFPAQCSNGTCKKDFNQNSALNCNITQLAPYSKTTISIEKTADGNISFSAS